MVTEDSAPSTADRGWRRYWRATEGRPPRPTLLHALRSFDGEGRSGGVAVDLGCGTGRDAVELVRRGWRVVAVDAEAEALARLRARTGTAAVLPVQARLETFTPPPARLVNASFSLFFLAPADLHALWARITACLEPGGRLAGQLLGPQDDWARSGRCCAHDRTALAMLTDGWTVELCTEEESDAVTPRGEAKHWHIWHLVLRRPSSRPGGSPAP